MIGKLLGIDHGMARIGIAVSDALGLTARELTIIRRKSKNEDFERINTIASEQNVVALIVGIPANDNDDTNSDSQVHKVKRWAKKLAQTTSLPILFWDEQLTSLDAREIAHAKRRRPKEPIDDLAARVMLQSYLDALRDGLASFPLEESQGEE
jgi:putative Holliday junction resolvase